MRRMLFAALAASVVVAPAWANIGRVKSVEGVPKIVRAGVAQSPTPGFILQKGDLITTAARSAVGMTFVDNSRIALGPNSRLRIVKFEFNDTTYRGTFIAEVQKGQAAIVGGQISRSDGKAMQVRTPKSVYAVRGSRIVVTVQ